MPAQATKSLKIEGRWYRIDAREAIKHNLPPRRWVSTMASDVFKNIDQQLENRVPLNDSLVANLRKEPIQNPILCGPDWWPYVGSQRLRACQYLHRTEGIEKPVLVCYLEKDMLSIWNLWGGNEGKRCQAIQVQLYELIFKSLYYPSSETVDGKKMVKFEEEGDKMYWSVRDDNPAWQDFGKDARKKILKGQAGDVAKWERTD